MVSDSSCELQICSNCPRCTSHLSDFIPEFFPSQLFSNWRKNSLFITNLCHHFSVDIFHTFLLIFKLRNLKKKNFLMYHPPLASFLWWDSFALFCSNFSKLIFLLPAMDLWSDEKGENCLHWASCPLSGEQSSHCKMLF